MADIIATYRLVKDPSKINEIADKLAIGLTVGSWTDLTALDRLHLEKYKGQVIDQKIVDEDKPLIEITIGYPEHNVTPDFSSILTTVFGKLSLDGKVKLVNIDFDEDYIKHFPGPAFGVRGIRDALNVYKRPLVMSIFKGIIGRDEDFFRQQLLDQALSGVDIIKDDEILYDVPELPFERRIVIAKEVLKQVERETQKKVLYAVNLSGPVFDLPSKARYAAELGANAFLLNVHAYGLDVLKGIRELNLGVPILAHPSMGGALCGSDEYGLSYPLLLSKLARLSGADLILFPAPYGSVPLKFEEAELIVREALVERVIEQAFPVPSAGIHPGMVKQLIDDFGKDIVINAGGGIHGHPGGAIEGGRAFRQAIDLYYGYPGGSAYEEAVKLWGT